MTVIPCKTDSSNHVRLWGMAAIMKTVCLQAQVEWTGVRKEDYSTAVQKGLQLSDDLSDARFIVSDNVLHQGISIFPEERGSEWDRVWARIGCCYNPDRLCGLQCANWRAS